MSPGLPGHRAPLCWLLLPFMAGLAAGKLFEPSVVPLLCGASVLFPAAVVSAWSRHRTAGRLWPVAIGALVALAGAAYYQLRLDRPAAWSGRPAREAQLTLRIGRLFPSPEDGRRVKGLATIAAAGPHQPELVGQRLYFSLIRSGGDGPLRSSKVTAVGVLELLDRRPPGGGFAAYLANAGINFQFTRGRLLAETAPASRYQQFCHAAELRLHRLLRSGLDDHRALAGVFGAMVLGQTQELSAEQKGLFMRSGTLHLFAISGQHISVIALCLESLLLLLRVPRLATALLGLALLWLYVDITGASPSAVRAFVMVALVIAAFTLRRPGGALAALVTSALVVLLADPMQLFSASFQMSYGIVAALVLLGAPLGAAMQARWPLFADLPEVSWQWHQRWSAGVWRGFLGMSGIGLAATLVSALTSVQFFNLFTPGALVANLVLIPLSSLVIGAGFLSLLCGLTGIAAAGVLFNHAGALLLWFMDHLVRVAVAVPGLFFPARFRWDWLGPAGHAALLGVCLAGYAWRWRRDRGGFWPPFVLVALLLAGGVRFGA
jgi:competence protein ComEC